MADDLAGISAILATPFAPDGQLDEASLRQVVDFGVGCGVHGLTILGIMGEFHKLTEAERERVTAVVLEHAAARLPGGSCGAGIGAARSRCSRTTYRSAGPKPGSSR